MKHHSVSQKHLVPPGAITAINVINPLQNSAVAPTVLTVVNNPAQPASTSGSSTAINNPAKSALNSADPLSRWKNKLKQQTEAAKSATPRKPNQKRSDYVVSLVQAPGGDRLTAQQLADAANVTPSTVGHITAIRVETEGMRYLSLTTRNQGETELAYGRRLKLYQPDHPNDDYVAVSGVPRTTLLDYPEFQPETSRVALLRREPQARQRKNESVKDWGLRLMIQYELTPCECARFCNQKVAIFRKATCKRTAGQAYPPKKAQNTQHETHVFTRPGVPVSTASALINTDTVLPAYLLREANQINALLNAADYPSTRFITVQDVDGTTIHYRRANMPLSSRDNPHSEIRLIRTNPPHGSMTDAYYELSYEGYRHPAPNRNDAESLYRALAQYEVLQLSEIPLAHLDPDNMTSGKSNNEEENEREQQAAERGAEARANVARTIKRYQEMANNALINQPVNTHQAAVMTTEITRVDDSSEDIVSLSSSVSSLSIEETAPVAKKTKLSPVIWDPQPEILPGLLTGLRQMIANNPEQVTGWISSEQLMEHAVLAVLSGKAHESGAALMKETAKALLNILATHSELLPQVYNILFPQNRELRLRFVNTIPLIIYSNTGVIITQLLRKICENPVFRREIKKTLIKNYIADRPQSEKYSLNNNFYTRLDLISKDIANLTTVNSYEILKKYEEECNRLGVNNINHRLNTSKINLSISLENLRESGLDKPASFLSKLTFKRHFKKPNLEEKKRLLAIMTNDAVRITNPSPISEDRIQRLLQRDAEKYTRWETHTNAFRASGRQLHDEQQKMRAQKRRDSLASAAAVSASLAVHSTRLAATRNAEKDREWDAQKDLQWQQDRAVRDIANETLRQQSPHFIAAAAGAAISGSMRELQSKVRPSAADIHSLIREGYALQENEKLKSKVASSPIVALHEEVSLDLPYSPLTRADSISSQIEGHINEMILRNSSSMDEDIPSIHLSDFESDMDIGLQSPDSAETEIYYPADSMSANTSIYSLEDPMTNTASTSNLNHEFYKAVNKTPDLSGGINNPHHAALPALDVAQQQVDAFLTDYPEEDYLELLLSLPDTPLHTPGIEDFSPENIALQVIEEMTILEDSNQQPNYPQTTRPSGSSPQDEPIALQAD